MPVLTPGQVQRLRDAQAAIEARILADTSVSRLILDGGLDRDYRIAAGETVCAQERASVIDAAEAAEDSNAIQLALGQTYEIAHRLADPFAESSYRPSPIDEDLAVLMDKHWWFKTYVHIIGAGTPDRSEIERIGNVIVYTVEARVALALPES